jgi:hypothetical protein
MVAVGEGVNVIVGEGEGEAVGEGENVGEGEGVGVQGPSAEVTTKLSNSVRLL